MPAARAAACLLLLCSPAGCTGQLSREEAPSDAALVDSKSVHSDGMMKLDQKVSPDTSSSPDATAPKPDATATKPDTTPPKPDATAPKPDANPPKPDATAPKPPPLVLSKVKWLHTNVSSWPVSAKLSSVTFKGSQICLNYNKAGVWPKNKINGVDVNANPWVFIWQGGLWYGATWEWMRPNQTCKNKSSVAGDHIKVKPFDAKSGWKPKSGQVLYFMVSGLARMSSITNVKARTAPVKVTWP